jgi:hypothetical protein
LLEGLRTRANPHEALTPPDAARLKISRIVEIARKWIGFVAAPALRVSRPDPWEKGTATSDEGHRLGSRQREGLVPLIDWMGLYAAFWHDRFDRLETLLNRMDQ